METHVGVAMKCVIGLHGCNGKAECDGALSLAPDLGDPVKPHTEKVYLSKYILTWTFTISLVPMPFFNGIPAHEKGFGSENSIDVDSQLISKSHVEQDPRRTKREKRPFA
jgi:hypothetical protein